MAAKIAWCVCLVCVLSVCASCVHRRVMIGVRSACQNVSVQEVCACVRACVRACVHSCVFSQVGGETGFRVRTVLAQMNVYLKVGRNHQI